jgi:integrase
VPSGDHSAEFVTKPPEAKRDVLLRARSVSQISTALVLGSTSDVAKRVSSGDSRNLVRGNLTTPKNHQCRRVDLSPQLRAVLRHWRRRKTVEWSKHGLARPDWVFSSAAGTALDESNVRKAFNQILDKGEMHRRGPHQMRHTFASLLLQAGEPITYVSAQMGHMDSAITLRV